MKVFLWITYNTANTHYVVEKMYLLRTKEKLEKMVVQSYMGNILKQIKLHTLLSYYICKKLFWIYIKVLH